MPAPLPDKIIVEKHRVACDGGGALGHPLIYLEMGDDDSVTCPYCSREFVLDHAKPRDTD